MNISTTPRISWIIFGIATSLTLASFYFDAVMDLEPCPLCLLQRTAVILIAITALCCMLHRPQQRGQRIYAMILASFSLFGLFIAGKQVWLQSLPADAAMNMACAPSLEYMLANLSVEDTITQLFTATGHCADVEWQFLSLSMPGWMVIWFSVLLGMSAAVWLRSREQ